MKTSRLVTRIATLTAAVLGCVWPAAFAVEVEKNLDKTFTVSPGGTLVLEADRGSVNVTVGANDTVEVKVFRKASGGTVAKAEEILAAHEVTFAQEGSQVRVKAKYAKEGSRWQWRGNNLQVRYEVAVPRQFNPQVTTAGGSITLADFTGEVRAQTAGGSIHIGRTDGPVVAKTAGGSIKIAGATGAIEADTAGGNINIKEADAQVDAETAGGSIEIGKVRGPVRAHTAGGSVAIAGAGGKVDAQTAGGSIRAELTGTPEEDCRFETAAGSIDLRLPASVSADLDAATSAGRVTCDLPVTVQGELKRDRVQGKLGSGGKLLKLRTSGGSIRIAAR